VNNPIPGQAEFVMNANNLAVQGDGWANAVSRFRKPDVEKVSSEFEELFAERMRSYR
jgi:hypothetical protein